MKQYMTIPICFLCIVSFTVVSLQAHTQGIQSVSSDERSGSEYANQDTSEFHISPSVFSMIIGRTRTVTAVFPADTKQRNVVWRSEHNEIATIDQFGNIKALKQGVTHIYAKAENGQEVSAELSVYPCSISMTNFFKEKKNSLDVLFIGDSNFYRGIMPTEIWKTSGITSYVIAIPSQGSWQAYYQLKQALLYQKPKVIVFEINQLTQTKPEKVDRDQRMLDSMMADPVRLEAVNDPINDMSADYQFSMVADTLRVQMNSLTGKTETVGSPSSYKGYIMTTSIKPYNRVKNYMQVNQNDFVIQKGSRDYFDKIVHLCRENDISIVLTKLPSVRECSTIAHNSAERFAQQYDIPYFDFTTDIKDNPVDMEHDTSDEGGHMNVFGAEKCSRAIASFLKERYTFEKHNDEEVIKSFNDGAAVLEKQKTDFMNQGITRDDER